MAYSEGDRVKWNWGSGAASGTVKQKYTQKINRTTIKANEVTREASESDPAYYIEQDDGDEVLKGHSELEKV